MSVKRQCSSSLHRALVPSGPPCPPLFGELIGSELNIAQHTHYNPRVGGDRGMWSQKPTLHNLRGTLDTPIFLDLENKAGSHCCPNCAIALPCLCPPLHKKRHYLKTLQFIFLFISSGAAALPPPPPGSIRSLHGSSTKTSGSIPKITSLKGFQRADENET